MIPILFSKNSTTFTTNGLGRLHVIECIVEESRNDTYEARFTISKNEKHFSEIELLSIVVIKVSDGTEQPFVVYKIEKETDEICAVYCEHISYKLRGIPVFPFQATSASEAMAKVKSESVVANPFTFSTNVTTNSTVDVRTPESVRSCLGGMEGSILDKFGGEYKFDKFHVSLLNSRGSDNGVTIRYGKNLVEFSDEVDTEDTVTGVLPYWTDGENMVIGDISYANNQLTPISNIVTEDVSSEFSDTKYSTYEYPAQESSGEENEQTNDEPDVPAHPSKAEVTQKGLERLNAKQYAGRMKENLKISFVNLADTEEYKNIAPLETVHLCDMVTVIFEPYNFSLKMKVTKTEWNALEERYESVELGDVRNSLVTEIIQQETDLEKAIRLLNDSSARIKKRFEVVEDGLEFEVSTRTAEGEDIYAELDLRIVNNDNGEELISLINAHADKIHFTANKIFQVDAPNWSVDKNGNMILTGDLYLKVYSSWQEPLKKFIDINTSSGDVAVSCSELDLSYLAKCNEIDCHQLKVFHFNEYASDYPSLFSAPGFYGIYEKDLDKVSTEIRGDEITFVNSFTVSGTNSQGETMNTKIGRYVHTKSVELMDPETVSTAPNCVIGNTGYLCLSQNASSKRWKNSITTNLDCDPHKLYELPVVQFKYNTDYLTNENDSRYDKPLIGFIAEDMDEVFPQAVDYDEEGKPNGWNEHYLIPAMMKLIQEQHEEIEKLKKEVHDLALQFTS